MDIFARNLLSPSMHKKESPWGICEFADCLLPKNCPGEFADCLLPEFMFTVKACKLSPLFSEARVLSVKSNSEIYED